METVEGELGIRELGSHRLGEFVMRELRKLDKVAYVRFASVYHQFGTLEEMIEEARRVIAARRYDVPGQGRLFGDEQAAASENHDRPVGNGTRARRTDGDKGGSRPPGLNAEIA